VDVPVAEQAKIFLAKFDRTLSFNAETTISTGIHFSRIQQKTC